MAEAVVSLTLRMDPDVGNIIGRLHTLIVSAYERGAISWVERQEMIDTLGREEALSFIDFHTYELPVSKDRLVAGVFAEPSQSFLSRLGFADADL
ncbi:solute carrier family 23 member 1 [Methylorubrum populi]|uniref:Solute carrier family 23 member 1 n=1 Tax=Methylorubrum populi TaxID=223967 RepID=A0A160PK76_9HYPH|nr:hypothetical protein [Methylorubrum populi]BAU93405.1 solute carrier family 23 member 1 [Methylorubrum populi]